MVAQTEVIWEGAVRCVLMLCPQIVLWSKVAVYIVDCHFQCQEHSRTAPSAIQIAEGEVLGHSNRKGPLLWNNPRAALGFWASGAHSNGPSGPKSYISLG